MSYDNFFKDFYEQHKAEQKRRAALLIKIKAALAITIIGVFLIWLI